jgi:hypothetical protein
MQIRMDRALCFIAASSRMIAWLLFVTPWESLRHHTRCYLPSPQGAPAASDE